MVKKTAPSAWDSKPFCRCVKVMARRCFVSSGIRFCLAVQRALALSRSTMVDYRHSVAAPSWPHADGGKPGCSRSPVATHLNNNRRPILPAGLFAVRWPGIAAATVPVANGGISGLLDTLPPETHKTGGNKAGLDPEWRRLAASAKPSWHSRKYLNGVVYHH